MTRVFPVICLTLFAGVAHAQDAPAREPYQCQYLEDAPDGVMAWAESDRIEQGIGTESRFVPYNSASARTLWRDATTERNIEEDEPAEGRETLFNMVYDEKGWYIYIQCNEPDIQSFIDEGRDISIELFFVPGLENVPYYQMMIRQLGRTVNYYDWAMPSRDYRSLEGRITVESRPLKDGVASFIFIPWHVLYDRVPFDGDTWRFSFMRWGGTSVTWGGKVHDTGNFGLVEFEEPSEEVATAIRRRNLRRAWFKFQRTAAAATEHWADEEMGDPDFYESTLKPAIEKQQAAGEALGDPDNWSDAAVQDSEALTKDLMEFNYRIQKLRRQYLVDAAFSEVN